MKKSNNSSDHRTIFDQPNYKPLPCSRCDRIVERVGFDAVSVICSKCTQQMVDPPKEYKAANIEFKDFPRGWKRKKLYVHEDGRVFECGVENEELNGTLPISEKVERTEKIRVSR